MILEFYHFLTIKLTWSDWDEMNNNSYILSKLITLVVVSINYHNVPTYLIFSANG